MLDGPTGCVMCELPVVDPPKMNVVHAFAAGLALSETVKGDPNAFDVCPEHRAIIELHRAAHRGQIAKFQPKKPVAIVNESVGKDGKEHRKDFEYCG